MFLRPSLTLSCSSAIHLSSYSGQKNTLDFSWSLELSPGFVKAFDMVNPFFYINHTLDVVREGLYPSGGFKSKLYNDDCDGWV